MSIMFAFTQIITETSPLMLHIKKIPNSFSVWLTKWHLFPCLQIMYFFKWTNFLIEPFSYQGIYQTEDVILLIFFFKLRSCLGFKDQNLKEHSSAFKIAILRMCWKFNIFGKNPKKLNQATQDTLFFLQKDHNEHTKKSMNFNMC